jgi:hypothetical protein
MITGARTALLGAVAVASAAALAPAADAATRERPTTRVEAPYTRVENGRKVAVDAPHAFVRVDRKTGRVVVRAPFVDLDVPRR